MGIDRIAIERGIEFKAANLWLRGSRVGGLSFGEIGGAISPYQYALILPQDIHEQLLVEQLQALEVEVERNTELISCSAADNEVQATIRKPSGKDEVCRVAYLAGCDGAGSTVREQLGLGFPGGTYADVYYVADIQGTGPVINGELNLALDDADFLAIFPMKGDGRARLVGAVRQPMQPGQDLRWEDVGETILDHLQLHVAEVKWFSTYHVHHRVAAHFQKGNIFLLGDAAHIHSPVGGQGMNTGIGDAVNLAWKLAAVLRGVSPRSLLNTYEPERIAFARRLVATTDRAFVFVSARGPIATQVRLRSGAVAAPFFVSIHGRSKTHVQNGFANSNQVPTEPLKPGIGGHDSRGPTIALGKIRGCRRSARRQLFRPGHSPMAGALLWRFGIAAASAV